MKKKKILTGFIFIILAILIYFVFPKKIEHAVVIDSKNGYISVYINDTIKKIRTSSNYPKFTVINFRYSFLFSFNFEVVNPLTDRVMMKDDTYCDLETMGKLKLSKNPHYYEVDSNNNITVAKSSNLIIGKKNLCYYPNKKGELNTFIIYPMDYSTMRVGISTTDFSSLYHSKVTLKCLTPAKLYSVRDPISMDIPKDASIVINKGGNDLKVTVDGTTLVLRNRLYLKGDAISFLEIERGSPAFTPKYGGVLEFMNSEKGISVINELSLENYLTKVVPSEMPSYSSMEALKCQAIVARTYALSDMLINRFSSLGFYVDDSTQSQVYNNVEPQSSTTAAVNSTKGIVLTYNGVPIDAKYYSTSCGVGTNYKDIWFTANGSSESRPYLVFNNYLTDKSFLPKTEDEWLAFYKDTNIQAADSSSDYYRWNVKFSTDGITRSLIKSLNNIFQLRKEYLTIYKDGNEAKDFPNLNKLEDIKILERSEGGNIKEISFIFDTATINVKGDYNVRGALRCSADFTNESNPIVRSKGSPLSNTNYLLSSFFSIEKSSTGYTIYGGGYGHGVGMSQYGAMELAKSGMKCEDILNLYYKDIKIENIY